jgi:hypothetical protein
MSFVQKYFPTTAAQDSGHGNVQGGHTFQGRSQLVKTGGLSERNCDLFSDSSGSIVNPNKIGADCKYSSSGAAVHAPTVEKMWAVYAHTQDQCCKSCVAASGCMSATYRAVDLHDDVVHGDGVGMPQPYEGFGLHLVNVATSKTTGGVNISTLEGHYTDRLSNLTRFDAFMDYNVVLFAGDDLPVYTGALSKDSVPFLVGTWKSQVGTPWYSVFVHVPESQMIIELVGKTPPATSAALVGAVPLEARMSPRNTERFSEAKGNGKLQAVAVTRAASNMTRIEYFYEEIVGLKAVHTVDTPTVTRRCYGWTGAKADVCFSKRAASSDYDETFSVVDMEENIWSAHKAIITDMNVYDDKYNDNHYAVDLMGFSGAKITAFLTEHEKDAFPINFPTTWYAWDCDQEYLIDPTGWAIQSDFNANYPGCTDRAMRLRN